jgi:hypothetical protein
MAQNLLQDRSRERFCSLVQLDEIRFFEPSDLDLVICGLPEVKNDRTPSHRTIVQCAPQMGKGKARKIALL